MEDKLLNLKDNCLEDLELIVGMIKKENQKQLEKWGIQNRSPFEWLAYLTEEIGELSNAISEKYYRRGTINEVVSEAIQVATLSMKIAEMYLKEHK